MFPTLAYVFALAGAGLGWYQAKRRGGNGKDMAQYAAVYGIAFGLLGMLVSVVLLRILG